MFPFPRRTLTVWALASAAVLVAAPALAEQKLQPQGSEIAFVSKQMGVPVKGHFQKFDATLVFDPAKPEAGSVAFQIDMGSATLGVKETDAELPKASWFNVPQFPQAQFQSSAIKATGKGQYEVSGTLNIKGNQQPLVVPVSLTQNGDTTTATGSFALERLRFKIGENEWADTSMVANEVQVTFKLMLSGVGKL